MKNKKDFIEPIKFLTDQQAINAVTHIVDADGRKEILDKAKEVITKQVRENMRKE